MSSLANHRAQMGWCVMSGEELLRPREENYSSESKISRKESFVIHLSSS